MTGNRGREFSRRDLFGVFRRSARGFRDSIERAAPQLAPAGSPRTPPAGSGRKLRPYTETLGATPDGQGGYIVDLRRSPLAVGASLKLAGPGLAEPLLAVRVTERHVAVVSGECSVDGSDVLYVAAGDCAECPSCGSRWRLDGSLTRGPADSALAGFLVEETSGLLRLRSSRS